MIINNIGAQLKRAVEGKSALYFADTTRASKYGWRCTTRTIPTCSLTVVRVHRMCMRQILQYHYPKSKETRDTNAMAAG